MREILADKAPGGITRSEFEERFVAFLDARSFPRPELNAPLAARDRILQAEGWRTARITWRQLENDPEAVAEDLRSMLAGSHYP